MSKKMCPDNTPIPVEGNNSTAQIRAFEPARLVEGKSTYVTYSAFNPVRGKLCRKTISINRIKGKTERRKYARHLIKQINTKLYAGWNPFIGGNIIDYPTFSELQSKYEESITKMYNSEYYRKETYVGYKSYLKNLVEYAEGKLYYAYQFDKKFCADFLDHIFIERDNSAQTHNNYLAFLKLFAAFALQKSYITSDPTTQLRPIDKRLIKKQREVIPPALLGEIRRHLEHKNRHFLLACMILYYCMIRPVEITRIRIGYFSLKNQTLTMPGDTTKNKQKETVTVPRCVIQLMLDLDIFSHPSGDYLFSRHLMPGKTQIDTVNFRHAWEDLRAALSLPKQYQFYSLKDSGITQMLEAKVANLTVRDQARHSSLAITDIYTPHEGKANPELLNYEGAL